MEYGRKKGSRDSQKSPFTFRQEILDMWRPQLRRQVRSRPKAEELELGKADQADHSFWSRKVLFADGSFWKEWRIAPVWSQEEKDPHLSSKGRVKSMTGSPLLILQQSGEIG